MASSDESSRIDQAAHQRQLRRAVLASTIGTAIEWYDFFLYSTVTGLVFAQLYFPRADPLVGTVEAFGVYENMTTYSRWDAPEWARGSWVALLPENACRDGYSALYTGAQSRFRDLAMRAPTVACAVG